MDLAQLKAEIQADPALLAMARAETPDTQAIANALSARLTRSAPVSRGVFAVWAGSTGMRAAIEDHAADKVSPLRSAALTLKDFLVGSADNIVDFRLQGNLDMLAAWEAALAITAEQKAALLALAQAPEHVSELDVRRAIFNDDGSRAV